MTPHDNIARVCAALRKLHADGVECPELLEAASMLDELSDAAADLVALDKMAETFDILKDEKIPIRFMEHEMDIREGINAYHPKNREKNAVAFYVHDCIYLHIKYKHGRQDGYGKRSPEWMFDWEWRPNIEVMRQKLIANAISPSGTRLKYNPGRFWFKNRRLDKPRGIEDPE